jgi:hypothetical protein
MHDETTQLLGPVSERDRERGLRMAAEAAKRKQQRQRLWGDGYAVTRRPNVRRSLKQDLKPGDRAQ